MEKIFFGLIDLGIISNIEYFPVLQLKAYNLAH